MGFILSIVVALGLLISVEMPPESPSKSTPSLLSQACETSSLADLDVSSEEETEKSELYFSGVVVHQPLAPLSARLCWTQCEAHPQATVKSLVCRPPPVELA